MGNRNDEVMTALEAAFEQEIAKVSTVEFNSNAICREFFERLRHRLGASLAEEQADPTAVETITQAPRLLVEYSDPYSNGPVISVMVIDPVQSAAWERCKALVHDAGANEIYWNNQVEALFLEGVYDSRANGDAYAGSFMKTTGWPEEFIDQLRDAYEEEMEPVRFYVDDINIPAFLKQVQQIRHGLGLPEASVNYADGIRVTNRNQVIAIHERPDDDGKILPFTISAPESGQEIPTVRLDGFAAEECAVPRP